jgi:hypothetical protein
MTSGSLSAEGSVEPLNTARLLHAAIHTQSREGSIPCLIQTAHPTMTPIVYFCIAHNGEGQLQMAPMNYFSCPISTCELHGPLVSFIIQFIAPNRLSPQLGVEAGLSARLSKPTSSNYPIPMHNRSNLPNEWQSLVHVFLYQKNLCAHVMHTTG